GAEPAESRGRGVQQLAGGIEGTREGGADRGQRMEARPELAQQRPARLGEMRLEGPGGLKGRPDVQELLGVQTSRARGALDRRPDVARAHDADPRSLLEEGARLIRLVEATLD